MKRRGKRRRDIFMYTYIQIKMICFHIYSPIAHRLQDQVLPRTPLGSKEEASRVVKLPHGLATVIIHDGGGLLIDVVGDRFV